MTNTGNVTLTGTVDETGLLVDVYDATTGADLVTDAPIQGESISVPLTFAAGNHDLQVTVVDAAAGVSPDADLSVFVDEVAPVVTIQPITPSVLSAPLSSATISFTEPVSGFTLANLQLTNGNGPNLLPGSATLTSSDNQTWTLGNLSGLTAAGGNYTLTVQPAGIRRRGRQCAGGRDLDRFRSERGATVAIAAVSPSVATRP